MIADLGIGAVLSKDALIAAEITIVLGGVLVAFAWWDAVCDEIASRSAGIERAERLLIPMTRRLVRATIIMIGVLIVLGLTIGTNKIAGLIAGLGVGGIVVALAAKDSIENLFGSLTVLFDMPFRLNDWVKIDKVEGVVEEINLRSTRIRTFEDTMITLPNANLIRAAVENYGARRTRRQKFTIRLSYESDVAAIQAMCIELRAKVAALPGVVPDRTVVEINDLTEGTLGILVQCHLDVPTFEEEAALRDQIIRLGLSFRTAAGIRFPGTAVGAPPPDEKV